MRYCPRYVISVYAQCCVRYCVRSRGTVLFLVSVGVSEHPVDRSFVFVCVIVCVTEIGAHKEALEKYAVKAVDNLHHDDPELDRHARREESKS